MLKWEQITIYSASVSITHCRFTYCMSYNILCLQFALQCLTIWSVGRILLYFSFCTEMCRLFVLSVLWHCSWYGMGKDAWSVKLDSQLETSCGPASGRLGSGYLLTLSYPPRPFFRNVTLQHWRFVCQLSYCCIAMFVLTKGLNRSRYYSHWQ